MLVFQRRYNTLLVTGTTAIRVPIIKRGVADYAVGADWTPVAGDVKIAVGAAAPTNITTLPTAVTSGNAAFWEFILTAAELTAKQAVVTISDAAVKAVEDTCFSVETFGDPSAMRSDCLGSDGSVTFTYTVYRDDDVTPIPDCEVWCSSDIDGVYRSQSRVTDDLGQVVFRLNPMTAYFWRRHSAWTFDDPDQESVS